FRPKAKSLYGKILPSSPYGSRFYADPVGVPLRKSLRINHFPTNDFRNGFELEAKSLFQNILPISHCGSRFCGDSTLSPSHKWLRMRILGIWTKKKSEYVRGQYFVDGIDLCPFDFIWLGAVKSVTRS